jgi:hypothetical protein
MALRGRRCGSGRGRRCARSGTDVMGDRRHGRPRRRPGRASNYVVVSECGRLEAPQPCLGVCIRRPTRMVNAARFDEVRAAAQPDRTAERALEPLARMLAFVRPRRGLETAGWRAVRELADRGLAAAGWPHREPACRCPTGVGRAVDAEPYLARRPATAPRRKRRARLPVGAQAVSSHGAQRRGGSRQGRSRGLTLR